MKTLPPLNNRLLSSMLFSTAIMLLLCRSGVACFGFNQQLYRRLALSRLTIKPNAPSSSALSLSTSSNNINNNDFHNISQLYGKTLVSIQDCISAYADEQYHQKPQDATTNNNKTPPPKVVFVDASWYHRPDPITNQLRSPSQEYIKGPRLPHARYIDIDFFF